MKILVLNAGSSTQKSCLYELNDAVPDSPLSPLWKATVDWSHHQEFAKIKVETASGEQLEQELQTNSRPDLIAYMLDTLWQGKTQVIANLDEINVVGHRVVHGGEKYREATIITPEVKEAIKNLCVLAPAHNPANLQGIEAIEKVLPIIPQVAVFDTAFHSQLPLAAAVYPIPYYLFEQGIRRYGFHGISHEYCAKKTAQLLNRDLASLRLITCHLGNGCSLAAIRNGHSIDTTMGFTPLEGLMMGTRSGSVDPGILINLLRQPEINIDKLDEILNRASGLKGISGLSGDMREIMIAIEKGNSRAKLAFDIFVHSLCRNIGAMLASLGGLDALIFTGGIGENSQDVRALVCEAFQFIDVKIERDKNAKSPVDCDISLADAKVRVLIVHTEEDWQIATECWKLMRVMKS